MGSSISKFQANATNNITYKGKILDLVCYEWHIDISMACYKI